MSSVRLTDGRVLHIPGGPFVLDSHSVIMALADDALADLVPLIPTEELLLFTGRLVTGARKRRRQPRYSDVNAARLKLARLCIDHALAEWPVVQVAARPSSDQRSPTLRQHHAPRTKVHR